MSFVDGGAVHRNHGAVLRQTDAARRAGRDELDHPATQAARERLIAAGFIEVTIMLGNPGEAGRQPSSGRRLIVSRIAGSASLVSDLTLFSATHE